MLKESIRGLRRGLTFGCAVLSMSNIGGQAMTDIPKTLAPCPQSPNCVCSDEDPSSSQYIAPFVSHKSEATPESGNGKELLAAIAAYVETRSEFRIGTQDDNNLQIEARSRLLRFVDDIEMRVRGNSVVVRSASRVGYSDLGKNRRRLESIRQAMIERGLVRPNGS